MQHANPTAMSMHRHLDWLLRGACGLLPSKLRDETVTSMTQAAVRDVPAVYMAGEINWCPYEVNG